jgi:hypothetical protein
MARNRRHEIKVDDLKCDWDHDDTFKSATDYMLEHDIKDKNDLVVEEECNLLLPRYISHHVRSAAIFLVYFVLLGFFITLGDEMMRGVMFMIMDYPFHGFVVTPDSGEMLSSVPSNAPWWWYFLMIVGPLLLVEGTILLVLILTTTTEEKPVFLDGTRSSKIEISTIKKAAGWFCAVKLIGMTIFFPITRIIYNLLLQQDRSSDLVMAWDAGAYIADPIEMLLMQILTILAFAYLLALSGLYLYSVSKTSSVT